MVKSSIVLSRKASLGQVPPGAPWLKVARTMDHERYQASGEKMPDQDHALQAVMAELVRGRTGVKPEEPLEVQSSNGRRSFLVLAWTFPGFHVLEIASTKAGDVIEAWESRYEFLPLALS